jgi:SAM-dependent methyltransferase
MPPLDRHYVDPRLVVLYDHDNPRGPDADFCVQLAAELGAHRMVDLGCGTGLLTCGLAVDGCEVIGVDPAPAMLDVARARPGADRVRWIEGDSRALGRLEADLAIMTGNVAQIFLNDGEWVATLRDLHDALRSGGALAFESRNPDDRGWERWTPEATYERIDSPNGPMECWLELVSVGNGRVRLQGHNVFADTGEDLIASSELRFRTRDEITASLRHASFTVEQVYGDWDRTPLTHTSRIMVFVARRD